MSTSTLGISRGIRSKHLCVISHCLRKLNYNAANRNSATNIHGGELENVKKTAALYLHWPYCKRRCTYCSFNKYIDRNVDEARMRDNLVRETETLINLSGVSTITSIFFGGGTPSLASPDTIASVINQVKSNVSFPQSGEITLEANPTSLEMCHLKSFRDAGITRLSLGVQTLKQDDLHVLGRNHSVEESLRCISEGQKLFPGRLSVDLMFGRPGQTVHAWIVELKQMLDVCDKHLSLYQLTLERGTHLFKAVSRGTVRLPSSEDVASMYKIAVQTLAENGYERYEVSNFAKEKAYSDHNLTYWRGQEYIGVGPGAHGRFYVGNTRQARIQTLEPDVWMREVEEWGHATRKIVRQSRLDHLEELLAVGLRTRVGISHSRWAEVSPLGLQDILGSSTQVQTYISQGLLHLDDIGLRASDTGLDVLDTMMPSLLLQLDQAHQAHET